MGKEAYVAYVGTYTRSSSIGIHIFDIDTDNWSMKERKSRTNQQSFGSDRISQRKISLFYR